MSHPGAPFSGSGNGASRAVGCADAQRAGEAGALLPPWVTDCPAAGAVVSMWGWGVRAPDTVHLSERQITLMEGQEEKPEHQLKQQVVIL